jgi:Secretion system C-terminal sorting domain
MKKFQLSAIAVLLFGSSFAQEKVINSEVTPLKGELIHITAPLESYKTIPLNNDVKVRDENGIIRPDGFRRKPFEPEVFPVAETFTEDPALQKNAGVSAIEGSGETDRVNTPLLFNFAGMGFSSVNPPDPTLCVGPNHIIQMINGTSGALFRVYNKTGGILLNTTFMDAITGRGGLGDPIALYDQFADRFVITEFANRAETGSEGLIFAVSRTNNPTGAWNVYFFSTGTVFPDYPKYSIWNNAIYGTTNDFTASYVGSSAYAFDKAAMYAGAASVGAQRFSLGNTSKSFSSCPVLLQGTTLPPAGTGGLIAYMSADEFTSSTLDRDSIGLLEFRVNFATPALSTLVARASLATAAYTANVCSAFRGQCVPMPGTASRLESLQGRTMNQPVYRRYGTYEAIALNHTVDRGTNVAGVRWYEIRKTTGNWFIQNQSTFSPDLTHRFMAASCLDSRGNLALIYNASSSTVFPGIRATARRVCDPVNTLATPEVTIIAGTASNSSTRYGDYSHLVADPDGVRFWATGQYNAAGTWSTRIAAFNVALCTVAPVLRETPAAASLISVNTVNDGELTIAPQPAQDIVAVSWHSAGTGEETLRLVNTSGQVMMQKAIASVKGVNTLRLDVKDYSGGTYVIQVTAGKSTLTGKLVIE